MAGNARRRILLLLRLFDERTDEHHTLTMPEILSALERNGIAADRRAVYEDIEELTYTGWEIMREPTGQRGYYLADRLFEEPELRILADSLRSSRFLTEQKTTLILNKLSKLAAPNYRPGLSGNFFKLSRPKGENGKVLYHIDTLTKAIFERKAVAFHYYRIDCHKRREFLNDDRELIVYPEKLLHHIDNYYLIAVNENWDHRHFRIDRMSDIRICDSLQRGNKLYNTAELNNYINSTFGPEAGKPILITLLCEKSCSDELFERFGTNTAVYGVTDTNFKADISASPGIQFYSWVFSQNGKVKILSPARVCNEMRELLLQQFRNHEE